MAGDPGSIAPTLLNDEEIVLFAHNGKIAAYALKKVLGGDELERAVRVRRMLVCEYPVVYTDSGI